MKQLFLCSFAVMLAACGNNTGATPIVSDADGSAEGDLVGTDAVADTKPLGCVSTEMGYCGLGDGIPCCSPLICMSDNSVPPPMGHCKLATDIGPDIPDVVDTNQCLPLFTACKPGDTCCAPWSCMNMGNGPQCQGEGPDVSPPPDVPKDALPDVAPDVPPDVVAPDAAITCKDGGDDVIPEPMCANGSTAFFPTFSKLCGSNADCAVALHQINCCGTKVAWGLTVCEMGPFSWAESLCDGQYPGCGCAEFQTMAEDGYSSFTNSDFVAKCVGGKCRSSIPTAKPTCTPQGLQDPKPVKACAAPSDCDFSMTTVDCCGSQVFVGIATFAKAAYDIEQTKCAGTMAICDCMPKPTTLEDGKVLTTNAVPLQCVNGACMTGTY